MVRCERVFTKIPVVMSPTKEKFLAHVICFLTAEWVSILLCFSSIFKASINRVLVSRAIVIRYYLKFGKNARRSNFKKNLTASASDSHLFLFRLDIRVNGRFLDFTKGKSHANKTLPGKTFRKSVNYSNLCTLFVDQRECA